MPHVSLTIRPRQSSDFLHELTMQVNALKTIIQARLVNRRERERNQRQLLAEDDQFHETIRAKLDGLWEATQFWNFSRCGAEDFYRTCVACSHVEKFRYRCNIKWCPRCAWRITAERKKILGLWAAKITQPKHLVLTQKNFPVLTPGRIRDNTRALAKMRRAKCFARVKGGCVTVEITNEGNGWHLHSHWLIDCRYLDMQAVSRKWGKLVGQNFAIVKIKDVRGKDYLKEVSKYVCEGSELASWPPEKIHEFVRAVKGRRFFFPFGTLFHQAKGIRLALQAEKPDAPVCECGCEKFIFRDEQAEEVADILALESRRAKQRGKRPQPAEIQRDDKRNRATEGYLAGIA